ncbi:MAG: hypothetical protein OEX77_04470 [Candidatus Bathyarchaeota archaeon]|nr:hypothetical protein [Candidatus Bathyarchaeota archaeon]MDH5733039.1 hypothetical protein [Candidatus Bathyarchaeota archaeon]
MKDRKRSKKTRARVQRRRKRLQYVVIIAFVLSIVVTSVVLFKSVLDRPSSSQAVIPSVEPNAAIVDHLSLTYPNQTFIQTATNILEGAGFTVDYYPGEQVTVELYRALPTHGYDVILLRVHSALREGTKFLALFTCEPYSTTKYWYEQWIDQVGIVEYQLGGDSYFGIGHEFILSGINGRFQNTVIIMMGCNGLEYTPLAEAFIQKGAKVYVGWNESVSASHTDHATITLLQHLIVQRQTIGTAIEETLQEVGPDPTDNSILLYYPLEAANFAIQNVET